MKIFAQHGYGPKDKLTLGLEEGIIDGVILSPRYWKPERMQAEIEKLQYDGAIIAMDPEFYATPFISHPSPNLGALEEWDYFRSPKRSTLISGSAIQRVLSSSVTAQSSLGLTHIIAPNVYIKQADSIETAIAINFLNETKRTCSQLTDVPVFGTLAIHRDALLSGRDFRELLDSLTGIDSPPDGYYIIVGSSEQQSTGRYVRSDLSQPEVIAGWMYANYVFSLNDAEVFNGYSFLLSPLLGMCGASASASGWSSGLRKFCIDRYVRTKGGGSAPNTRYVSNALMAHIKQTDLDAFSALDSEVLNGIDSDQPYTDGEPSRTEEALQAWDALKAATDLSGNLIDDSPELIDDFCDKIEESRTRWRHLQSVGLSSEAEQNIERLNAMERGIEIFSEWAELA